MGAFFFSNMTEQIVILDFGSQYTQVIARRIRECNVYSIIVRYDIPARELAAMNPKGIILSGGPSSVYEEGAPSVDPRIFELGVPILGICYGMQLLAHLLGGKVERSNKREFGHAKVIVDKPEGIFHRFAKREAAFCFLTIRTKETASH